MSIPTAMLRKSKEKDVASFGTRVFSRKQIEEMLPKDEAANWLRAMDGREPIQKEYLDSFAHALKEWAIKAGATHFAHWFQPLTGSGAEKHDAFLSYGKGGVVKTFSGRDLLQGEPDASSFPNGGLRCTAEARGYTVWDPSTPPFLWNGADGLTLCIPSLFFSWKGDSLDYKIPLLRSDQKIEDAALRLLKLAKIEAKAVFSTLGPEQEYFVIDRVHYEERLDLKLAGRTVYGAKPAKGQELEDHYFSSLNEETLAFMREVEEEAFLLGIPLKTRHNEVAPSQHEAAPLFEKASLASDHNLLLMEIMRKTAERRGLACLFHEKPFAGINGSGKHCNWSLATDQGLNLLDPKGDRLVFLTLLAAILRGVFEHSLLLRSSIATASNDWRLGGSEAPPTILSVYLGEALETCVEEIIHEKPGAEAIARKIDLGLRLLPPHLLDSSDRNRTSFFAFTGNKFEFRAVGASQPTAWPVSIINAIVADSLQLILDEIEDERAKHPKTDLFEAALPVLRKHFKMAQPVLYSGNNYAAEWVEEAERRHLPNVKKSCHSYSVLRDLKTEKIFHGILSKSELESRFEILTERYAKEVAIECLLMIDLFKTKILPAAICWQKEVAKALRELRDLQMGSKRQQEMLLELTSRIDKAIEAVGELEKIKKQIADLGWEAAASAYSDLALPRMEEARAAVDILEGLVDDALWPLPKYSEILFK